MANRWQEYYWNRTQRVQHTTVTTVLPSFNNRETGPEVVQLIQSPEISH